MNIVITMMIVVIMMDLKDTSVAGGDHKNGGAMEQHVKGGIGEKSGDFWRERGWGRGGGIKHLYKQELEKMHSIPEDILKCSTSVCEVLRLFMLFCVHNKEEALKAATKNLCCLRNRLRV